LPLQFHLAVTKVIALAIANVSRGTASLETAKEASSKDNTAGVKSKIDRSNLAPNKKDNTADGKYQT
jgi:hypothetical protein